MSTLANIQRKVGVEPDGVWGPRTASAIWKALADADGGLQPSQAIIDYVKAIEKLAKVRPDGMVQAYMPTPNDRPTIGYGTTGPDVQMGTVWTRARCEERFAEHFAEFAQGVTDALDGAPTTQGQYDAMCSLAYNIGQTAFRNSTLLKAHKSGAYTTAQKEFAKWNKQAGQVLNGLTKRRAYEAQVYGS
ncbi:MAG: lysozyme [Sphingobium sp.]